MSAILTHMPIEVLPGASRFRTTGAGRDTRHSFSFGMHYDPHNVGFGALLVHNDDRLDPDAGYPDHPHANTEILTWVISGALHHRDDLGHDGVLEAGGIQVLSAGSGVVHTEYADGAPTRFVQSWIRPDDFDQPPSYAQSSVTDEYTCVASSYGAALRLHTRGASCHVATLGSGESIELPDSPRLHVFAATGAVAVGERLLETGDAARLVHEGGRRVHADADSTRLLIWALP
jgi:redox-sensitive bicupin YhaK (pirin superfamily)